MSKRKAKEAAERENEAFDALIVLAMASNPLPELTPEERAAMDALPDDFIGRILAGERPLG